MGRSSSRCDKEGANKGAWTAHEDQVLRDYVKENGEGKWGKMSRETGENSLSVISTMNTASFSSMKMAE